MSWKKLKQKMAAAKALGPHLFEAKKQGVALRGQCRINSDEFSSFDFTAEASALSVVQKDYYGDHSLLYLCENPSVTGKKLDQLLSVKGGAELARHRRADGDYPFHYLCRNPKVAILYFHLIVFSFFVLKGWKSRIVVMYVESLNITENTKIGEW
jgi:hypothetical protein